MAGRDRRSNMEIGKVHSLSASAGVFINFHHSSTFSFSPISIKITTSCYPVPSICCHDLVYDWFESLAQCLHWNVRKRQARLADISDSSDTENWNSRCVYWPELKTVSRRSAAAEWVRRGGGVCDDHEVSWQKRQTVTGRARVYRQRYISPKNSMYNEQTVYTVFNTLSRHLITFQ